jgi:hypothetical protein
MFEHKSERPRTEGSEMTILDTREIQATPVVRPVNRPTGVRRRPPSRRPGGAPVRYRNSGVLVSRASHRRRPITPVTTVLLAVVAAGITVWLGLVAQFGGVVGESAPVPDKLAVVQVQTGETLQHVAGRVAPDAPVTQVIDRIRELNQLDTVAIHAGQTLIAPIS